MTDTGSGSEGRVSETQARTHWEGKRPNRVVKLLERNPLGMTLPEMAGGPRKIRIIRNLRPHLAEAIRVGLVMPVSQRAGHTVYRLVRDLGPR